MQAQCYTNLNVFLMLYRSQCVLNVIQISMYVKYVLNVILKLKVYFVKHGMAFLLCYSV